MIFSQPDQYGCAPDVEAIRAYWGWFLKERRGGKTIRDTGATVGAYVSANNWVADCPTCGGGIACWELNPHGCCLTCGSLYQVVFPNQHQAAAQVLADRPPRNRHWFPNRGETVQDLKRENVAHAKDIANVQSLGPLYPVGE